MNGCPANLPPHTVLLGRTDYNVRAIDKSSGVERWNISFAQINPDFVKGSVKELTIQQQKQENQLQTSNKLGGGVFASIDGFVKIGDHEWHTKLESPLLDSFVLSSSDGISNHLSPLIIQSTSPGTK